MEVIQISGRPKKHYQWDGFKSARQIGELFEVKHARARQIISKYKTTKKLFEIDGRVVPYYKLLN